ncbi:MAG TPA: YjbH domain-containing protein [Armatimonadota bacterium]|nr:YjbH domain-containing protein [Armatimonadota bacterium]
MNNRSAYRRQCGRRFFMMAAIGLGFGLAIIAPIHADEAPSTAPLPPTSLEGTTGLIRIPTAEVTPYGRYIIGVNTLDHAYRAFPGQAGDTVAHFITVGLLPGLEVSGRFLNHDGKLGFQFRENLGGGYGGYNIDRMFSAQLLLKRQTAHWPVSLSIGAQDLTGSGVYRTQYLALSHRSERWGLHVGYGNKRLDGIYTGADFQAMPALRLMLEYDGSNTNAGAALSFHKFTFTPVFAGMRSFGGGISYNQPL